MNSKKLTNFILGAMVLGELASYLVNPLKGSRNLIHAGVRSF